MEFVKAKSIAHSLGGKGEGPSWKVCCPCHDDKNPSLSIKFADEKLLLKCFAGCSYESIIEFLKNRGIYPGHEYSSGNKKKMTSNQIWIESKPLEHVPNNPASKYLQNRGLSNFEKKTCFRYHPALEYFKEGEFLGKFPALIGAIKSPVGELVGIQRIYLTDDGKKAFDRDSKKTLGSLKGNFVTIEGKDPKIIAVVEGVETGLAVNEATGLTVLAILGSNFDSFVSPLGVKEIHFFGDKDKSRTGEKCLNVARKLASKSCRTFAHFPSDEIPDGANGIDWLDVFNKFGASRFEDALNDARSEIGPDVNDEWESPGEIDFILAQRGAMNHEFIPEGLKKWIIDGCERLGVPYEYMLIPTICSIAIVLGRKVHICPKKLDKQWKVNLSCLWGMVIAPSGSRKSPAFKAARAPLELLEKLAYQKYVEEKNRIEPEMKLLDSKSKGLEKAIKSKVGKLENVEELESELKEIYKKMKDLEPINRRYTTQDATVEKLGEILTDNKNGIGVFVDELSGTLRSFEKKGHETARAFYLEGWNGNSSYTFDRIIRGTKRVDNVHIILYGGIQQEVLKEYIENAQSGSGADGLLGRFQLMVFPPCEKYIRSIDRKMDNKSLQAVFSIFNRIDSISIQEGGYEISFSSNAQKRFDSFYERCDFSAHDKEKHHSLRSHISKMPGTVAALSLIFEIIDYAASTSEHENIQFNAILSHVEVSEESINLAIRWYDLLIEHAVTIYGYKQQYIIDRARFLGEKIRENVIKDGATIRNIYRHGWTGLDSKEKLVPVLEYLELKNWIRIGENRSGLGRPQEYIKINPNLFSSEHKEADKTDNSATSMSDDESESVIFDCDEEAV